MSRANESQSGSSRHTPGLTKAYFAMSRFFFRLLVVACCLLLSHRVDAQNYTVVAAHGDAELGKDRSSYKPAEAGSTNSIPSWAKTADNSSLTIAFNPENKFRLLALSEAQVTTGGESDSTSEWHRVVSLKIGQASFDHNLGTAPAVHLDCETPTAVCGAVGTEYDVDATAGVYSVSSGQISVSSDQEGALTLTNINAGGTVTYNPGRENTYSKGNFTGTVRIDGVSFRAADADFTVAKLVDSSSETAVHISSGTLGGTGPGDYLMDGGKLQRVAAGSKAATIHPQYLAAAKLEGRLNVERAADRATNRAFGAEAELENATAEATRLRKELFTRETVREINKQTVQSIQDASRNAASQAAAAAAEAAARSAARMGR